MKIILVHKADFPTRPPVISSLLILSNLGHELILVTEGISDYWMNELNSRGITVEVIPNKLRGKFSVIGKFIAYSNFRSSFKKILKKYFIGKKNELIWVEGAYTIVALGKIIQKYKYILQIQELHENSRTQLNAIGKVIQQASCVFMPEYNRSILYQVWYKLKKRPIVLPNKPYFIPSIEQLDNIKSKYLEYVKFFSENKVILYQGHISEERDLTSFAKAMKHLPNDYRLVLMGKDHGNFVSIYRKYCPNLLHIDYIPAPDYLLMTRLCYIGIVAYNPLELNTTFCAPNKIYEYGAFGKPIVANNIPGLKIVESTNAGCVFNDEDTDIDISNLILQIHNQYAYYSDGSHVLFDSTNNSKIIKNVLNNI